MWPVTVAPAGTPSPPRTRLPPRTTASRCRPVSRSTSAPTRVQEWFEAGACDGFSLAIDVYQDGIDAFVDQVVSLLQERGLFHNDYEGTTLRDHLGVPAQYGTDPRLS
jgi:hypothetical protein